MAEKERVLGCVVTPPAKDQNAHVVSVLTKKMAEEIGLNKTIETGPGSMNLDRFCGWPGNILQAFYSVLTLEHVFGVGKEYVNAHVDMRDKALELIHNSDIRNEDN